ncbi:GNAT family N-acetyltransferase [Streptomyces sp. NPDC058195]|uniref:GNAT family N-acetyltransferase n=1 Tax=Streptomyces sp. NPDC058195 TaxID=3346375 RepID=UPI0036E3420D
MTELDLLDDSAAWQQDFERRTRAAYTMSGLDAPAAEHMLDGVRRTACTWTVAGIMDAGTRVGYAAVVVAEENGAVVSRVGDLHVDAAHTGRGHERAALDWAERWCEERGATVIRVRLAEPADGLFDAYGLRGQLRARRIDFPPELVKDFAARPMTPADFPEWLATEKASYADNITRSGALSAEEALRKSDRDFAELIPEGLDTPDNTFLVLEANGEPVGTGWLKHGYLPGVTYGYGLRMAEEHRGKGFGRAAMAAGERATLASGDSALMFSVWGGNEVAMNLYTSAGYRIVEENRSLPLSRSSG